MKQWEYKLEVMNPKYSGKIGMPTRRPQIKRFNQLGKQGWELIAVWKTSLGEDLGIYKRSKNDGAERDEPCRFGPLL